MAEDYELTATVEEVIRDTMGWSTSETVVRDVAQRAVKAIRALVGARVDRINIEIAQLAVRVAQLEQRYTEEV